MSGVRKHGSVGATLALAAALAIATPAPAQLLGGGVGGLPGAALPGVGLPDLPRPDLAGVTGSVGELGRTPLDQVRRLTAARLLRDHRDVVEADDHGQPVVRGEVLAMGVSSATAERLRAAGFSVRPSADLGGLGIESLVVGLPRGLSAVEAVRRLRGLDPEGQYDFNHLYQEGGLVDGAVTAAGAPKAAGGRGLRIGVVDGAAAQSRPALAGVSMTQRGFAPGGGRPSAHATAVASLIAGSMGSAPGASLYVADVYGTTATGGSAQAVAQGLAWLAQSRTPVINISLVGPPNLLLEAAVKALIARGHILVAAVGNDGPAAPPLYPAAYPGVVSVTAVDARRRVLPEAGRGGHVDFTARGSDLTAAGPAGGLTRVRGTSFAAPIVAGELARLIDAPDRAAATRAVDALGQAATDLGAPGPDPIYGRGLVGPSGADGRAK